MIANGNGQKNRLEAVILDMDGVIIDSHPVHLHAWQRFLETLGRNTSRGELAYVLDGRKRSEILRHFFGELSEAEILEYGKRKDEFFETVSMEVKLLPGVKEFLGRVKKQKISLAVATSASATRTQSTLKRLNLNQFFTAVVTGDDIEQGKPDPAVYRTACERLGVSPENALAFEDAVSGIRAAKAARLRCIAVAGHEPSNKFQSAGADHIIQDFVGLSVNDLTHILERNHRSEIFSRRLAASI
jgi:beta-phosphoglucomutase